jgi:hypothetical protein
MRRRESGDQRRASAKGYGASAVGSSAAPHATGSAGAAPTTDARSAVTGAAAQREDERDIADAGSQRVCQ